MSNVKDRELEITRRVFGICLGLLMMAGILLRWLGWGESLLVIAWDTLVPLALSVGLYLLQKRFHLLETVTDWVERMRILALAGPVVLAAVGIGLHMMGFYVETYLSVAVGISYCLVLQIWDDLDRVKALLMTNAVAVGYLFAAAYTQCPGTMIVTAILGLVMQSLGHHYWSKEPWSLSGRTTNWLSALLYAAVLFLCSRVEYVTDGFMEGLLRCCEQDTIYLAKDVSEMVRVYAVFAGDAGLMVNPWIRDSGNGLLYILSRAGWLAAVPLAVSAVLLDMAGIHLFGLCRPRNTYISCLAAMLLGVMIACDVLRLFGIENMLDLGSVLFLDGFGSNLLTLVLAVILVTATETEEEVWEEYEGEEILE